MTREARGTVVGTVRVEAKHGAETSIEGDDQGGAEQADTDQSHDWA